jgi:hypothetical protein
MRFKQYINEIGFKNYPKGWNRSSVRKFAKTLSNNIDKDIDEKGWFDACVKKMEPDMGENAKGFCASVRDEYFGQTKWRSGEKKVKPGKVPKKVNEEDINVFKKIFKSKFEVIKNESELDNFYNQVSNENLDKEKKEWLEKNFKKISKQLEINKSYNF